MHKHHPSHSLLFVLLVIPLVLLVAFTANDTTKQSIQTKAQSNPSTAPTTALITPTYGVIAPCIGCITPTLFQEPVTNPVYPSNIVATPIGSTTLAPCQTENAAIAHDRKKSKHRHRHHDKGAIRDISEMLLKFLIELLNLLLKLIGGGIVPPPNPDPTISQAPSVVPDPCEPSAAPSAAPQPTINPSPGPSVVPSSAPTTVITNPPAVSQPITAAPSPAPTQVSACIPSGGKCDATGARKCCSNACVPNINPNYPNDPGTCD